MNRTLLQRLLWLALTALLVLTGAALPFAAVWLQDAAGEERTELRSFEAVQLSLRQELEVGQVLRLLSGSVEGSGWNTGERGGTTWIEWQSGTCLTQEGVEKTVLGLLDQMSAEGMLRQPSADWTWTLRCHMNPNLVVSGSIRDLSAVIWTVSWELVPAEDAELPESAAYVDQAVHGSMYIDDATGQMVGMVIPVSNYWKKLSLTERMKITIGFLEGYYGMDIREVEEIAFPAQAIGPEDEFSDHILRFDMGELGLCEVELMQDRSWVYFNV